MEDQRARFCFRLGFSILFSTLFFFETLVAVENPRGLLHVYLTWFEDDTASTMGVMAVVDGHWIPEVRYDTEDYGDNADAYSFTAQPEAWQSLDYPTHQRILEPLHEVDRLRLERAQEFLRNRHVYKIPLSNLDSTQSYYFIVGNKHQGFSQPRRFRTVPEDATSITFVGAGDTGIGREGVENYFIEAAKQEPHFVAFGGDLAYADGMLEKYTSWDIFFDLWEEYMVTPEGYTIPIVAAIGNHETYSPNFSNRRKLFEELANVSVLKGDRSGKRILKRGKGKKTKSVPFFFKFFPQDPEGKSYFVRRFGDGMVLFVLDTGHKSAYGDPQLSWLKENLQRYRDSRYLAAIYHEPAFPSHRSPFLTITNTMTRSWVPWFYKNGLHCGFENDDHTQKSTYPMVPDPKHLLGWRPVKPEPASIATVSPQETASPEEAGTVAANGAQTNLHEPELEILEGMIFVGDGCFGKKPREINGMDYLRVAKREAHFWLVDVDLEAGQAHYRARGFQDGRPHNHDEFVQVLPNPLETPEQEDR